MFLTFARPPLYAVWLGQDMLSRRVRRANAVDGNLSMIEKYRMYASDGVNTQIIIFPNYDPQVSR